MFTNSAGVPVAKKSFTIQIDVPSEAANGKSLGTVNFIAVFGDMIALAGALASGNPVTIVAAIQQLITDITG
jgi:ABC-type nitrate/sulfonate/bicarbonate transport system substrate-binding protein